MWKLSNALMWRLYGVQVSEAYSKVDMETTRYTAAFVAILLFLLQNTLSLSRPKAEDAE